METYKNAVFIFEILTALLASFYYGKYRNNFFRYFLFLIWYCVANEMLALWFQKNISANNAVFYNIYRIIEFTFFLLLYRSIAATKRDKKIATYLLGAYYFSVFVNCFFADFLKEFFAYSFFVGAVFVCICIVIYFSEILNSEKIVFVTRSVLFWVSIAAFVYYITSVPFKVMMKYFNQSTSIPYIYLANYAVVFIYYLIISFGLIWSKGEQKY